MRHDHVVLDEVKAESLLDGDQLPHGVSAQVILLSGHQVPQIQQEFVHDVLAEARQVRHVIDKDSHGLMRSWQGRRGSVKEDMSKTCSAGFICKGQTRFVGPFAPHQTRAARREWPRHETVNPVGNELEVVE